jgi:hypothetical protein
MEAGLNWWRAFGAVDPEIVIVDVQGTARRVIGPVTWTALSDFTDSGEWLGKVTPPTQTESAKTSVKISRKRRATANTCPPELEALLGTTKDAELARAYNINPLQIGKWRTERGIARFVKANNSDLPPEPEADTATEAEATEAEATEADATETEPKAKRAKVDPDFIVLRFGQRATDEEMATELGVPVKVVVDARRELGLHRPRGRKAGTKVVTQTNHVEESSWASD